jgi:hypothetical protein
VGITIFLPWQTTGSSGDRVIDLALLRGGLMEGLEGGVDEGAACTVPLSKNPRRFGMIPGSFRGQGLNTMDLGSHAPSEPIAAVRLNSHLYFSAQLGDRSAISASTGLDRACPLFAAPPGSNYMPPSIRHKAEASCQFIASSTAPAPARQNRSGPGGAPWQQ